MHWLSGTRATLRNMGTTVCWLTYSNGLPRPGGPGATPPPPMTQLPPLDLGVIDDLETSATDEKVAPTPPVTPDGAAPAPPEGTPPAAPDSPTGGPSGRTPIAGGPAKTLGALPGNPAFVGGFASLHPNVALCAMGDGSIRAVTRNTPATILQRLAHRADGKLIGDF